MQNYIMTPLHYMLPSVSATLCKNDPCITESTGGGRFYAAVFDDSKFYSYRQAVQQKTRLSAGKDLYLARVA